MNLNGLNLFPLNRAISRIPADYYVDRHLNVYSTRTAGRPLMLQGSRNGTKRYYTFAGAGTISSDLIRTSVMNNPQFMAETAPSTPAQMPIFPRDTGNPVATAVTGAMTPVTKQSTSVHVNAQDGIARRGFVLATLGANGELSFSANPKIHADGASAQREAERLATASPGKTVVRLQIVDSVKVGGVVWS